MVLFDGGWDYQTYTYLELASYILGIVESVVYPLKTMTKTKMLALLLGYGVGLGVGGGDESKRGFGVRIISGMCRSIHV